MRTGWMLAVAVLLLAMGTSMAQAQCCGDTAAYTTYYAGPSCGAGGCCGATVDTGCSSCGTSCCPTTSCCTSYYAPVYDTGCCGSSWGGGWRGWRGGWRTAYYGGSCCW